MVKLILMIPLFYYIQKIYGAYFLVHLNKFKVGSIEKIFFVSKK